MAFWETGESLRRHCDTFYQVATGTDLKSETSAHPGEPAKSDRIDAADKLLAARNLVVALSMMADAVHDRDKMNALSQVAYNAVDAIDEAMVALDSGEGDE